MFLIVFPLYVDSKTSKDNYLEKDKSILDILDVESARLLQ